MQFSYYRNSMQTFGALVYRDITIYVPFVFEKTINALVWISSTALAFEYIFPQLGMPSMGGVVAVGGLAVWNFFSILHNITMFIADLEGERSISYYLTLPIKQEFVLLRIAVSVALQGMLLSSSFLAFFKVLLGKGLDLSHISYAKFLLIYCSYNFFYGALTLFFASFVKQLYTVLTVWQRYMWPLWYFGCAQFSWATLYKANYIAAYGDLLNPLTYIMEGTRAAVLGQEGNLNFWWCFLMIWMFTLVVLSVGIRRLKRRLDCI